MSWVKLDDGFHSHPKVRKAGNTGAGVYARALSWCGAYYTDGFISRADAALIGKTAELKHVTEAELWEEISPGDSRTITGRRDSGNRPLPDVTLSFDAYGFFITDYLQSNPTKAEVEAARAKRAAAGAKGGQANAQADAQANAEAFAWDGSASNAQALPSPAQPNEDKDSAEASAENVIDERVMKLLRVCRDADEGTPDVLRRWLKGASEADFGWAYECATGPGVLRPAAVAVAELKKRAEGRAA